MSKANPVEPYWEDEDVRYEILWCQDPQDPRPRISVGQPESEVQEFWGTYARIEIDDRTPKAEREEVALRFLREAREKYDLPGVEFKFRLRRFTEAVYHDGGF